MPASFIAAQKLQQMPLFVNHDNNSRIKVIYSPESGQYLTLSTACCFSIIGIRMKLNPI